MWAWQQRANGIRCGVTDRVGGVSVGDFGSLNLGLHVGDDAGAVLENRRRVAASWDVPPQRLALMDQCHGAEVAIADGRATQAPAVDGLVSTTPGVMLVAMVADCVPVMLADPAARVVGVAHAGRPGMMKGVVTEVISLMRSEGAREIHAWVGPSVCGRCYEVPAELRDEAAAVTPEAATVTWAGTPAIDVPAAVVAQLAGAVSELTWLPGCTRERADLFSHRRDGRTGRFAGVVMIEE